MTLNFCPRERRLSRINMCMDREWGIKQIVWYCECKYCVQEGWGRGNRRFLWEVGDDSHINYHPFPPWTGSGTALNTVICSLGDDFRVEELLSWMHQKSTSLHREECCPVIEASWNLFFQYFRTWWKHTIRPKLGLRDWKHTTYKAKTAQHRSCSIEYSHMLMTAYQYVLYTRPITYTLCTHPIIYTHHWAWLTGDIGAMEI